MINDHAKQRPFAMKREANETGKQKNGQRRPKCAKLSSGEPAMPVKDIFPLSLVTPAKISRWTPDRHALGTYHPPGRELARRHERRYLLSEEPKNEHILSLCGVRPAQEVALALGPLTFGLPIKHTGAEPSMHVHSISLDGIYMLVPKCALSQFANWDPSLRTRIYLSQFGNWDHRHNLSLQTGINREIMNI